MFKQLLIAIWTDQTTSGKLKKGNKKLKRLRHLLSKKTNASTLEAGEDLLNVAVIVDRHAVEEDLMLPIRTTIDETTETMTETTMRGLIMKTVSSEVDLEAEDAVEVEVVAVLIDLIEDTKTMITGTKKITTKTTQSSGNRLKTREVVTIIPLVATTTEVVIAIGVVGEVETRTQRLETMIATITTAIMTITAVRVRIEAVVTLIVTTEITITKNLMKIIKLRSALGRIRNKKENQIKTTSGSKAGALEIGIIKRL